MSAVTVIAEAGVNHNGDVGRAVEMVAAAAEAGAGIVKFQHFRAETLTSRSAPTATYQKSNTGRDEQFSLLKDLELDIDAFERIANACDRHGIEFLCTAFETDVIDVFTGMGMKRVKIPSGEITNIPMLRSISERQLPIILSTGMATMPEVDDALRALDPGTHPGITLLHCTSTYPAPAEAVNLRAMPALADRFGLPVGYSDHTMGTHAAVAAVAMGASMIEKHFTLDRRLEGPDHLASLEPQELAEMVDLIHSTSAMMGDGIKRPTEAELDTARIVRRSWHAARDISSGARIEANDVTLLRPASGMAPAESPVGKTARRAFTAGEPIVRDGIEGDAS